MNNSRPISELSRVEIIECFSCLTNIDWFHRVDELKVRRFKREGEGYVTIIFPLSSLRGEPLSETGKCTITDSLEIFVNLGVDKRSFVNLSAASMIAALDNLNVKGATSCKITSQK